MSGHVMTRLVLPIFTSISCPINDSSLLSVNDSSGSMLLISTPTKVALANCVLAVI